MMKMLMNGTVAVILMDLSLLSIRQCRYRSLAIFAYYTIKYLSIKRNNENLINHLEYNFMLSYRYSVQWALFECDLLLFWHRYDSVIKSVFTCWRHNHIVNVLALLIRSKIIIIAKCMSTVRKRWKKKTGRMKESRYVWFFWLHSILIAILY